MTTDGGKAIRSMGSRALAAMAFGLLGGTIPCVVEAAFQDPLEFAAAPVSRLSERSMQGVAKAGRRLVAVGARGVIAFSDDNGKSWSQSRSPVQSDLLAIHFPTADRGWVVGHDGVVLHSRDGGLTWEKQLDGRAAKDPFMLHYKQGAESGNAEHKAALAALARNFKDGPALPFLDVWFEDERNGYAVGAFGMIIMTSDGGGTWVPILERISNPEMLNLNAIRGANGAVLVAAERGGIYRLDRATGRFEHVDTGYTGSFFGLTASKGAVLAYGLRGAVYASLDQGKNWKPATTSGGATISAGTALTDSGEFVLVSIAGEILVGDPSATRFVTRKVVKGWRGTGLVELSGDQLVVTALEGIRIESLK